MGCVSIRNLNRKNMSVSHKPEGYHTVTPYVMVMGIDKLIEFATAAFAAETRHTVADENGRVIHAEIAIGDLMLTLAEARPPEWPAQPVSFYLYVPDCDALYHKALAAGGTSIMEPADQFYGDRHGGVKDASGNSWWVATHIEDVSPEEMKRRSEEWAKQRGAT